MKTAILMTFITLQAFAVNFIEDEYDLTEVHNDARVELENTVRNYKNIFPFQLSQDLGFLRHRLAKRPKFINREDEIPYIRHDVFIMDELGPQLKAYKQDQQILDLLETFQALKEQYQVILDNHDIISK